MLSAGNGADERKQRIIMAAEGRVNQPDPITGYVPVHGLEMYYEIPGEGSPLVLLHGSMGTIDSCFAGLLPALAAARQVIAMELQGHGHTADIPRPLSYHQMADDTATVLLTLGVGTGGAAGYRMGGSGRLRHGRGRRAADGHELSWDDTTACFRGRHVVSARRRVPRDARGAGARSGGSQRLILAPGLPARCAVSRRVDHPGCQGPRA